MCGSVLAATFVIAVVSIAPVPVNVAAWADAAGCASEPTAEAVADDVSLQIYPDCESGEVELYVVDEGGHAWPGAAGMAERDDPVIAAVIGRVTMSIDASDLAWEFFGSHALGA